MMQRSRHEGGRHAGESTATGTPAEGNQTSTAVIPCIHQIPPNTEAEAAMMTITTELRAYTPRYGGELPVDGGRSRMLFIYASRHQRQLVSLVTLHDIYRIRRRRCGF